MKPFILMAALNGARKNKSHHAALPLSVDEIASQAQACFECGAHALHLHVRDESGQHSLDPGIYREAMAEVQCRAPDMVIQITTEAAGLFAPPEQMALIRDVVPESFSVALRELEADKNTDSLNFLHWASEAGIHTQYILYSPQDVTRFVVLAPKLRQSRHHVIFVLGQYSPERHATPQEITPMLAAAKGCNLSWMVCAFGPNEQACVEQAAKLGGHGRIGFENNLWRADGSLAKDNAELIADMATIAPRPLAMTAEIRNEWENRSAK